MKKILITGATGFIGNHLIQAYLAQTKYHIIATSRDMQKAREYPWFHQVTYIPYTIESSIKNNNLYDYFEKPDLLIHLAWEGLPNYTDLLHLEKNLFNHYDFLKNLVINGLKKVTVTGTCLEYGQQDGCLREEIRTQPSNAYAIAKDTLRKFIEQLSLLYAFEYKWIRLFYMHGHGQAEHSLLSLLEKAIKQQAKEFNMSQGEQLRDYLHISDVVKNIMLICSQNLFTNQAINCCSGEPISVRHLVEQYLHDNQYSLKLNLGHYAYPSYESMAFWGDNSKLNIIRGKV